MRKSFVVFLCLTVVFAVGFGSYRGYKIWKQKHLIRQASEFISKGDSPNALLCLRQALQSNSSNVEACRLMATYAELARSPQAVFWRGRLVELEPNSLSNRVALATVALAVGDATLAQSALDGVDGPGRKTALYHRMSKRVLLVSRHRWPRRCSGVQPIQRSRPATFQAAEPNNRQANTRPSRSRAKYFRFSPTQL